ncbi:MAG: DUF192 domain-containing protein [Patescibacteria group bacterium]|jgi:hypothetical protein
MRKLLIILVLFFLLSGCQFKAIEDRVISVNGQELNVEVVKSSAKMSKGLSGRTGLCQNCGMLFEYQGDQIRNFWMKDMEFPLDILWIKDDLVVGLQENIPIFDLAGQISQMQSPQPVNRILEVNSGWISKNKPKIGDKVLGL